MNKVLLDTSAFIELFEGTDQGAVVCGFIEDGVAATTVLCVAELSDIYSRKKKPFDNESDFLQRYIRILSPSFQASIDAGVLKNTHRKISPSFGLVDAIIYQTAIEHDLRLVTKDKDFASLPGVQLL